MIISQIRPGAYYDSVVLMQLQRALVALPGIEDAGVVMGAAANKDVLAQSGLLDDAGEKAGAEDLIIVLRCDRAAAAEAALAEIDALLARKTQATASDFRPHSLDTAALQAPHAAWVLVSVPGRFATTVARDALRLGKNVFLYSDNVALADEIELKRTAARQGLLVMGPDCGTAIVSGAGFGFANRVRRGSIGLVSASGTGLQLVTACIHQLGGGVSHAFGAGGRDLSEAVGAITTRQALTILAADPETRVIVVISKPPAASVAEELIRIARTAGKPVIVDFIGYRPVDMTQGNVYFAATLDGAASLAVEIAAFEDTRQVVQDRGFAPGQRYLRGVFSGGTLAYEAQLLLADYLPAVYSNAPLDKKFKLARATESHEHTIVDLGEDEFTVGRLHPMMDNELRIKRILQEAADPETAVLLVDIVLGDGAHPDPAAELAPALVRARTLAETYGRRLELIAVVVGTDQDPQDLAAQIDQLHTAGVHVETSNEAAVRYAGEIMQVLGPATDLPRVSSAATSSPLAAINVGLESFATSLMAQGVTVTQVDWRPPAGGNEKLMGILERMKTRPGN